MTQLSKEVQQSANPPDDSSWRTEMEQLGEQLASRQSITDLARGLGCVMVVIISSGACWRLVRDSARTPIIFWLVLAVFLSTFTGACFFLVRGRSRLIRERQQYRRYVELRSKAGFD